MPGLLRGVARTAVVAGTATAVSNRVSRRQAGRWARPEQAQAEPADAPPPAPGETPAADDMQARLEQLGTLGTLRDQGVLTDAEFEVQTARILGG